MKVLGEIESDFLKDELRLFRKGERLNRSMIEKTIHLVGELTKIMLVSNGYTHRIRYGENRGAEQIGVQLAARDVGSLAKYLNAVPETQGSAVALDPVPAVRILIQDAEHDKALL